MNIDKLTERLNYLKEEIEQIKEAKEQNNGKTNNNMHKYK